MQRHLLYWLAIVTLFGFGFATSGLAQPPQRISLQGQLTDEFSETLPDDDYQMIFSIYNQEVGGDALWSETQTVALHGGLYDVVLGAVAALDLPFDVPYFLGIDVDGDGEMDPRLPLTSVAYALRAAEADGVSDGAIVSQMLAPGAVETDAVADGAITAAKITDGPGSGLDADLLDGHSAGDFLGIGGGSLSGPLSVPSLAIGSYTALTLGGDDNQSTFLGHNTDHASSVGWHNTMLGSSTGSSLTYGEFNTFVGSYAGTRAQDSYANTFVGASAGLTTISGDYNLCVGVAAGQLNVTGSDNTFIGSMAGANLHSGSGNLFLGHQAGPYQVGSNMLVMGAIPFSCIVKAPESPDPTRSLKISLDSCHNCLYLSAHEQRHDHSRAQSISRRYRFDSTADCRQS